MVSGPVLLGVAAKGHPHPLSARALSEVQSREYQRYCIPYFTDEAQRREMSCPKYTAR